jgi:hypothetical protein
MPRKKKKKESSEEEVSSDEKPKKSRSNPRELKRKVIQQIIGF